MAKTEIGICHLCGQYGPLSYEHVPPEAAFNGRKVFRASVEDYWQRGGPEGRSVPGKQLQRGYGDYTLCGECNNKTGRWYAPDFIDWCRQGMRFWDLTKGKAGVIDLCTILPAPGHQANCDHVYVAESQRLSSPPPKPRQVRA